MTSRSLALLAFCLPLLSACGGSTVWAGDSVHIPGGLIRLALKGTVPDYEVGEIVPYQRFDIPAEELPRGWHLLPEAATVPVRRAARNGDEPWEGLRFEKKGQLSIPGPFDPARFNRVAVTLALTAKADLYVDLNAGGKTIYESARVRVEGTRHPQTAIVDLPGTQGLPQTIDRLNLRVVPQGGKPTLIGFELLSSPIARWLPTAEEGFRAVPIQGEARHAIGLSSRNPLRAKELAPPEYDLYFAYALPKSVHRAGDSLSIHVQATDPGGRTLVDERIPVRKVDQWQDAHFPLDHDEGEAIEVEFTLEGAQGETESLVAIASPRFERVLADPPAVLLVTSDTQRADQLGLHGSTRTPFLDRLAENGVLFDDCYSATNITNPSHASILTGLSTRDTGMSDNITALSDEAVTLADCFQAAGFYTIASLSAKHLGHAQSGLGQGFDQLAYPPVRGSVDSPVSIAPLEEWLTQSSTRPLFAWLHVFDAHTPYVVPEEYQRLYYDEKLDPYDPSLPPLVGKARVAWDPEIRDAAYVVAQYRSEVTYLDEQLASALAHPRLAKAILAVTADHGEHLGSHGLYWTHQGLYPETLSVPLILSWPDGPVGVRVSTPVSQLDLGRTLLDLAGVPWADFPGENLLRWLNPDEGPAPPRFSLSSHEMSAAISYEGWFLVLNLRAHSAPSRAEHQVELYHVSEDPTCKNDLVDQEFERARELRAKLVAWLEEAPEETLSHSTDVSDPEVLAQLAALGYASEASDTRKNGRLFVDSPETNEWDRRFAR